MNLRTLKINTRLGLGFGVMLGSAVILLFGSMLSQRYSSISLVESLDRTSAIERDAVELRDSLLEGAIAVRNMGLVSDVGELHRHQAVAEGTRKTFLAVAKKLEDAAATTEEKELVSSILALDQEMNVQFKEAVNFAAVMSTDQSNAVITGKIDPLLGKIKERIQRLRDVQHAQAIAVNARASAQSSLNLVVVMVACVLALAGAALLAWRIARSITVPLSAALAATHEVANGNLSVDIKVEGRDEAAGLMHGLVTMRESLASMVESVRLGAESISNASREIAQGNADLSARTEMQASALQQTAATMDQLDATVRDNAASAHQADDLARGATNVAATGSAVFAKVVDTMTGINESSSKIAEIIGVIDGIAFQTNILALNAAVEAARAGEQGRGFAVVASEVRALAQRSADAARQIKSLVQTSVARIEQGSSLVSQASQNMAEIASSINRVSSIVGEISAASAEQSSGVNQIGITVSQLDQTTQQNSALVEESAAAAESLRQQAAQLLESMSMFHLPAAR